jgi:hypothetical protein
MTQNRCYSKWIWLSVLLAASAVHFGTAALRLNGFNALDFSSYYAAAASSRLDISPYPFSSEFLAFLEENKELPEKVPRFNSAPLWAWLLQPLAVLPFPSAMVLWLLILGAVVVFCHILLVRIAGYEDWKIAAVTLPLTATFGPMFLNLTLGQNAAILLLSALIMGEALRRRSRSYKVLWIPLWIVAVAGKLFPALWLGCRPYLKSPRTLFSALGLFLVAFLGIAWLKPVVNESYWQSYFVRRAQRYSSVSAGIDDQSFTAYLDRIAQRRRFSFHGIDASEKHRGTWNAPWDFSDRTIRIASITVAFLMGIWLLYSWIRAGNRSPDAELYSLVLFVLIFFPNIQRYNHVLALPAMAWLWQKGLWGRRLVIIAYTLFALSRLNHAWAAYFPPAAAMLASGFGLFGVMLLFFGITFIFLKPYRKTTLNAAPQS